MFSPNLSNANMLNSSHYSETYFTKGINYYNKGEYVNATNDFKRACDLKYEDGCKALRIIS